MGDHSSSPTPPRVFVSYSHDDEEHKGWVLALAHRLKLNGVNTLLDQWGLRLGSDLAYFMESGLSGADRVIAVCTDTYVKKANAGMGGVGYEKMILTAELMDNLRSEKIIPILIANETGKLPAFLGGRVYVDFRAASVYEESYANLVRDLHGMSALTSPAIGVNPFAGGNAPVLAFTKERYVSPALRGRVVFDFSNNDGSYIVGSGDLAFETRWSRAGSDSIYAYKDATNIERISLAMGVHTFADLGDASFYDDSSRVRHPYVGEIVIWRNQGGYYLATKIERVNLRVQDQGMDELTFSYMIQADRTSIFPL